MPIRITATIRDDAEFSADQDEAAFMQRAQGPFVRIACPDLADTVPVDVDEMMSRLDFEDAGMNDKGWVVGVEDRACAVRLLAAGLLDQTGDDIVARWSNLASPTRSR